ncbi:MAG: Plasmid pRiA4b ORF-3-like protein [Candidatus Argoarchaeum ethanivorans]|uniref:Plasmid pRiA4b ORF-3-like protein n=1 Tax=Candidatus Argoarchaeum ethanivorans TaxID=2608793 RepID=A0A811T536_9EURY|nr:MAG: Plasmid pRiA4b ORF-3-like protein [Candidatus Argoarchaeum ethanivorans]
MKKKFNQVYQFKISLLGIRPPIWRRIQVPETYTFWDLHVAIQDVMGWADYHLHEFGITSPENGEKVRIGIHEENFDKKLLPEWKQKIADYFSQENEKADYVYDFGDNWEHIIKLEKILPREENIKYPVCIKGKRACSPEDCGGIGGYYNLLEIIKNPNHERYEEMLDWIGGEFDLERFDVEEVSFDDPGKRQKIAFG